MTPTTPSAEALAARVKQLANEYAHCYSFVGDDTMPIKKRELEEAIDRLAALSAEPKAQAKLASSGQAASAVPELRMGGRMQVKPDYSDLSREALEAHAARMAQALQELWPKTPRAAPASPTQPASAPAREGEVVVTKDEAGAIVAVTRQDDEGRILSVIAEATPAAPAQPRAPSIEPVGHVIEVEEHVSGTWGQKRRVRCVVWTGEPPAVGEALFLRVALPTAPASAVAPSIEPSPKQEKTHAETSSSLPARNGVVPYVLRLTFDEWQAKHGPNGGAYDIEQQRAGWNGALASLVAAPEARETAEPVRHLRLSWAGFVNLSADMEPGPLRTQLRGHAERIRGYLDSLEDQSPPAVEKPAEPVADVRVYWYHPDNPTSESYLIGKIDYSPVELAKGRNDGDTFKLYAAPVSQAEPDKYTGEEIYAAWLAVGADVAGLSWVDFAGKLSGHTSQHVPGKASATSATT